MRIITVRNLTLIPPRWWEAVVLTMIPEQVQIGETVKLHYKMFFDTMYLTKFERLVPPMCARCGSLLN